MREYKGKVLLITNVASQCGYTEANYKGLQQLYDKYQDRGLQVIPGLQGTWQIICMGDPHACGVLVLNICTCSGLLMSSVSTRDSSCGSDVRDEVSHLHAGLGIPLQPVWEPGARRWCQHQTICSAEVRVHPSP